MQEESPGQRACAERTFAYWNDTNNFPIYTERRGKDCTVDPLTVTVSTNGFVGRWFTLLEHYIDTIDVLLNGKML